MPFFTDQVANNLSHILVKQIQILIYSIVPAQAFSLFRGEFYPRTPVSFLQSTQEHDTCWLEIEAELPSCSLPAIWVFALSE